MSVIHDLHRQHVERRRRLFGLRPARARRIPKPTPPPEPPPPPPPPVELEVLVAKVESLMLDRPGGRPFRVIEIAAEVADFYGLTLIDLLSHRRTRNVCRPRQVAMYLAKHLTARSLPDIARRMGGRDHTTVVHAVQKIESLRASDDRLRDEIQLITGRLAAKSVQVSQ